MSKHLLQRICLPILLVAVLLASFLAILPVDVQAADGDTYYWVGGTGNTSDLNHWSNTSGGAGGAFATAPNSTNNLRFDANSFSGAGQVVTVDATLTYKDMDWTGAANSPTLAGSGAMAFSGSITFIHDMDITRTAPIAYTGSGSSSFTTGGQDIPFTLQINSGTLTLQDAYVSSGIGDITQQLTGTLNTNGQSVSTRSFTIQATGSKTLIIGNSTISCTSWNYIGSGLTVTANTATINISGTGALTAGAVDYNGATFNLNGTAHTVSGVFTCANLTRTGTATKTDSVTFTSGTTVTVTDTLTLAGNSATNRLLVQSSTLGSPATLNAATVSVSNADFMDITGAGAGSWDLSGAIGGSGDCGGNTDITFTAPAAQTSSKASTWSDATMWTSRVPLPQDDVSCSHNVTVDMPRIGKNITFGGTPTVSLSNDISTFGSWNWGGATPSGNYAVYFCGRANYTITSNGISFPRNILFNAPNGTYTLTDNLSFSANYALALYYGAFNASTFNVSGGSIILSGTGMRTLSMGSGIWTFSITSASTKWNVNTANLTFDAGTSTIVLTNSGTNAQTFAGSGLTYNNVIVQGAGNYNLTITGNNTFNDFKVDTSQAPKTITATGTTQIVNDFTRNAGGTNVISLTGGTWTKSDTTPIALDYLTVTNSTASPADTWYAGSNSTDGTGNTDWIFDDPALAITTDACTGVTMDKDGVTGGTFNGSIATLLEGTPTITTYFEYGLTAAYGSQTANVTVYDNGAFTGLIPNNLTPGETYHYRVVVENGNAGSPFYGDDATFTLTMPSVTTNAASNVSLNNLLIDVTLNGTISSMGVASNTDYYFEWGYTPAYGNFTATTVKNIAGGYSVNMVGMDGGNTLYYRVVTENGSVTSVGAQQTVVLPAVASLFNIEQIMRLIPFLIFAGLLISGGFFITLGIRSGDGNAKNIISGVVLIIIALILLPIVISVLDVLL